MSCGRWLIWLGSLVIACAVPAPALALDFQGGSVMEVLNSAGEPEARAGAHPDRLVLRFELEQAEGAAEEPKDFVADLSAGLGGDPGAVPLCPRSVVVEGAAEEDCPDSRVGLAVAFFLNEEGKDVELKVPLYNVHPGPNEVAVFGGFALVPVFLSAHLRPEDQGLSLRLSDLSQLPFTLRGGRVEFWGVPANHQEGTSVLPKALLTLPTRCDAGPPSVVLSVDTWQNPGQWSRTMIDSGHPLTGCDDLPFEPGVQVSFDEPVADAPTGARIELSVPQSDDPNGLASSQVRDAIVSLPEGMTLAPGAVARLAACSDAQLDLGTATKASCTPSSRVGSVELTGPGLLKPVSGAIYLGQERPGDRFRLFVVAAGMGAELKLVISLHPDPRTGRLFASLSDLPQLSFENLALSFDGGGGALLATPVSCGAAVSNASFAPYSGAATVQRSRVVDIAGHGGGGCAEPPPFAPAFTGGSTSTKAGRATAFSAIVERRDGEQLPSRLTIALPAGMSAALSSVNICPIGASASGACPAGSQIGQAFVELGPGHAPARLEGSVYLTAPQRRTPFEVALVFPARLGPFDLGTLVVRGALHINPLSGRVAIAMDPLPRVFEGITVRFQSIGLKIDRPAFLRNPTSCAPASTDAAISAVGGLISRSTSRFRTRGCHSLPFRPAFSMALTGPSQQHEHGRPGLQILARIGSAGTNLRAADFTLPTALGFDASGLEAICARPAAIAGRCPAASRVGSGRARTPMFRKSLRGPLYVVQPRSSGTPDLWASLRGRGIRIELRTETSESDGHLGTELRGLPDLPLTSFTMKIASGRRGLLSLRHGLCSHGGVRKLTTAARLVGQNHALRRVRLPLLARPRCQS